MEGITNILIFCFGFGIQILCAILVMRGVWNWFKRGKTQIDRQSNMAFWISLIVLVILSIINNSDILNLLKDEQGNKEITTIFINTSKIMVKVLMLGTVVVAAIMLLFFAVYFMYKVIAIVASKRNTLENDLAETSKKLGEILRTPIIIYVITWGIMAIFVVLPLLMGNQGNQDGMANAWKRGVVRIACFVESETVQVKDSGDVEIGNAKDILEEVDLENNEVENTTVLENVGESFYQALVKYILIFIVVLGLGFATVRILYSIIDNTFSTKNSNVLIDEYSGSMGVLVVGVSILWTIQDKEFFQQPPLDMLADCIKSFGFVIFIVAMTILTLEIIRLLMDMKETLIRKEARYIFISLVGQVAILLLEVMNSICKAVNGAVGNPENENMDQIEVRMKKKMIFIMDQESGNIKNEENMMFPSFSKKITKK
ncbi:MAG: hypothetical protein NC543_04925 [bacterium]|nr:hypothetical protein [bacterium]MCM1374882.1 hypothetical protein [Muribaculum sp.]